MPVIETIDKYLKDDNIKYLNIKAPYGSGKT